MEVGGEGDYIPIATLSPQNDSYIKMGSDKSHFNVSFCEEQRHKTAHRPQLLKRKESRSRFEPRSFCLPA